MAHAHAADAGIVREERERGRLVEHRNAGPLERAVQCLHEMLAAAPDVAGEPAPESEASAHLEGLPAERGLEAHAVALQPEARIVAIVDEDVGELRVAAELGEPAHVLEIAIGRVAPEIDAGEVEIGDVGREPDQVLDVGIDEAEGPSGEGRVPRARVGRCGLHHQHARPRGTGGECGIGGGIARADDDDIGARGLGWVHGVLPDPADRLIWII